MSALAGLRVLDFSRFLPGPYCTWLLADQGAEVIRVENPRELAKQAKVFGWDKLDDAGRAAIRARDILARGKKSITLDIGSSQGRAALLKLGESVDVVVEDYRPGVLAGLGLGHDDFAAVNPKVITTSLTLCGQTGPYRDKPGHDPVALAIAGVLARCGENPDAPGMPGIPAADVTTGSHAAFATLAALRHADNTGRGQHVDVSMTDCALGLLVNLYSRHPDPDSAPPRGTRRNDLGIWQCADGKWLVTTDMEPRYWQTFCTVMGRADFIPRQLDRSAAGEMRNHFAAKFAEKPREVWIERLAAAGTQFAPINSPSEALRDPHLIARGAVMTVTGPDGAALTQIGPPVRLGAHPVPHHAVAPGAHNDEILTALGYAPTGLDTTTTGAENP